MILKASERGDAPQLARYLLSQRDNDHVELHEVRGFVSDDLHAAFAEADAIAKGTRCKNYLFSMSLNPPQHEQVSVDAFEKAADAIEERLGLEGQPRAIVFHEKDGRRHAHVVWSKIDAEHMRAINLSHYKLDLRELSRQFFREHGWTMPKGLRDWRDRDPLTFTKEEWQQARRAGLDPKDLKALFKSCWERSDSPDAFAQALKERGFVLAKGDRRGFVALDYRGEVYAVARYAGVKTKDVVARFGRPDGLPSVEEARQEIAAQMTAKVAAFLRQEELEAQRGAKALAFRRAEMVSRHKEERKALREAQERRWTAETQARAERLPKGFSGIWQRITGKYAKIRERNEREAWQALLRDRAQKDDLIADQLNERSALQREIKEQKERQQASLLALREDVTRYQDLIAKERADERPEPEREPEERQRDRERGRDRGFDS